MVMLVGFFGIAPSGVCVSVMRFDGSGVGMPSSRSLNCWLWFSPVLSKKSLSPSFVNLLSLRVRSLGLGWLGESYPTSTSRSSSSLSFALCVWSVSVSGDESLFSNDRFKSGISYVSSGEASFSSSVAGAWVGVKVPVSGCLGLGLFISGYWGHVFGEGLTHPGHLSPGR